MVNLHVALEPYMLESFQGWHLIALVVALAGVAWVYQTVQPFLRYALQELTLPYRDLRGPPSESWVSGVQRALMSAPNGSLQAKWIAEYGSTFRYPSTSQASSILTVDPLAIDYIHRHSDIFKQPKATRLFSQEYMGPSLTAVEGAHHRRQRRAIAPSFGSAQITVMIPDLFEKATLLVEKVKARAGGEVNMTPLLNALAVDAIGSAAFGADIGALREENSELMAAFRGLMFMNQAGGLVELLQRYHVPFSRLFKTRRQHALDHAHDLMKTIGRKLIAEKRHAITEEAGGNMVRKEDFASHDLMSNILRQNMATDVKEDQRMSDEEVLAQIPLFLFAGNNTVAVTLNWAVGMLAKHPEYQSALREEVLRVGMDQPEWDSLNGLPYLEAFTHELIRLYPAAPTNFRHPNQAVILPLSTPVIGRSGRPIHTINVPKGAAVHMAYGNMNWSTDVFGPDAIEFRPERFLKGQTAPWEHTLSFGGGERVCIGSRFAIAELKVALFAMVRSLEFSEIPSKPNFERFGGLGAVRPKVDGKVAMPVIVKAVGE